MKIKHIFPLLITSLATVFAAQASTQTNEVDNSILATGNWVKIRVSADGVYGLSDTKLRELGFTNPSKVKVFGYEPTILLDHNPATTPKDLPVIQSVYADGQLLFYVRGNVDLASELMSSQKTSTYVHEIHSHSKGATYFLSDADCDASEIVMQTEDYDDEEVTEVLSTHKSVIYYEDEAENYANGGAWFVGKALGGSNPTESHSLHLNKIADQATAEMYYVGILSPEGNNANNYIQAVYDNGVIVTTTAGTYCRAIDSHEIYRSSLRLQKLQLPQDAVNGDLTFNVEFSVNPSAGSMAGPCALDYFMFKYDRLNDLSDESQVMMYFDNSVNVSLEMSGAEEGNWKFWNVTNPAEVKEMSFSELQTENGTTLQGELSACAASMANAVVAFRTDVLQPEPEIIGTIPNQNLHSLSVPDLVIITSELMMPSAEEAAAFHRRHQNLDVAIVDQQQIFNEYSSGNVSPEGVRLFINDLYGKDNQKLKAVLLMGPATFRNAQVISPENAEVVANENEDYAKSAKLTHNFCNDAFFGYIGGPVTAGNWASRHRYYKVYGNEVRIPVGRLPYSSIDDVRAYYSKAENYVMNPPVSPQIGNIILASDYAAANEASHMYDAGTLVNVLGDKANSEITVTYAASNLFSVQNNIVNRRVMKSALERGAQMMAYFGHGDRAQIGGSTNTTDYLICNTNVKDIVTPGRYPAIYFFGSCTVGAFDQEQNNLASALVKSEFGGPIAMIASSREVYQPENRALGQAVTKALFSAENGTWLGEIWREALSFSTRDVIDYICNQLSYNFVGDPALPLYASTNSVNINAVNGSDNAMIAGGLNEVSGTVTDFDGNVDTDFNGNVLLTVYDVPVKMPNLTKTSGLTIHSTYVDSVATDFTVIGEFKGAVKNGEFTLSFVGPASSMSGAHRIQAYAYSSDGAKRGVGCVTELVLNESETPVVPDAAPIQINSLIAGNGLSDEVYPETCLLKAEINAPAGLASVNPLQNPARLVVDGVVYTNVARLLNYSGDGKYTLEYPLSGLSLGRHKAILKVQDAIGNWAEAEVEFTTLRTPDAVLSVSVDESIANFDLSSALVNPESSVLVIESLSGELIKAVEVNTFPFETTLSPGAYRAFVQQKDGRSVTSTSKVELFVN